MYSLQDLNWAPGQPDNVYGGAQDFLYSLENLFLCLASLDSHILKKCFS